MSKKIQVAVTSVVGLVVIVGAFLFGSGILSFNYQSASAASIFSYLFGKPTISITRNINSPKGVIMPNRSQVFAVFDGSAKGLKQTSSINELNINLSIAGNDKVAIQNFVLTYQYCLPKGNIYAYGYKYGYSGIFCRTLTILPTSYTRVGSTYQLKFTPNLPVYPSQTSGILSIAGYPYYTTNPAQLGDARIQATVTQASVTTSTCKRVQVTPTYGYSKCTPLTLTQKFNMSGNKLVLSRSYGYGYSPVVWTPSTPTGTSTPPTATSTPSQATSTPITSKGWTTSATSTVAVVNAPVSITAFVKNASDVSNAIVQVEVWNSANARRFQEIYNKQNFVAGKDVPYKVSWTPKNAGQHYVRVAIFDGKRFVYGNNPLKIFVGTTTQAR